MEPVPTLCAMGLGPVLVVDPDPRVLHTLGEVLTRAGYEPRLAGSFEDAMDCLKTLTFDYVVTAHRLVAYNGLHVVLRVRSDGRNVGTVISTPIADSVLEHDAAEFGAVIVVAPWDRPEDLLAALARSRTPQPSDRVR
jgi:ActR/RegA family two-component response regulator